MAWLTVTVVLHIYPWANTNGPSMTTKRPFSYRTVILGPTTTVASLTASWANMWKPTLTKPKRVGGTVNIANGFA